MKWYNLLFASLPTWLSRFLFTHQVMNIFLGKKSLFSFEFLIQSLFATKLN